MAYPNRIKSDFPRFNFLDYPNLTFEKADTKTFKNLSLAYLALDEGGTMACALNAANEITNAAFLSKKISFLDIAAINEIVMKASTFIKSPTISDYVACDQEARDRANQFCK
tara:strand:- start:853 stop:1188 length:336 start_codon:yes stop_codon:yes gene_type:complete